MLLSSQDEKYDAIFSYCTIFLSFYFAQNEEKKTKKKYPHRGKDNNHGVDLAEICQFLTFKCDSLVVCEWKQTPTNTIAWAIPFN